jgi:simple sugar transport system ATP-binding protein
MALCDTATVLRGGRVTANCDPRQETPKSLAEMMIGSELPVAVHPAPAEDGPECLGVNGLSLASDDPFGTDLQDVRLSVRGGEIVGIAGVAGNGQRELLMALSGERLAPRAEDVVIVGRPVGRTGPADRRARGLAFVPEERLGRGAVPEMDLADNALLTGYHKELVQTGFIRFGRTRDFAEQVCEAFNVVCGGTESEAKSLSGGNLQKFIIGREIRLAPKLLILAHPTWGVDVGAAATIRQAVIDLRNAGTAILVVSEDLDELFEISDRITVIANGLLSPAKATNETSVEEVGRWMGGVFADAGEGVPKDAA